MFSLKGKTCVVTGAGKGIGRGICLAYAAQGAKIVGAARSEADLAALAAEITASGGAIAVQPTDVTDPAQLESLATLAQTRFGRIDAWVNNAGGFVPSADAMTDMIDVKESTIEAMFRLNVTAQILGAQVAARAMRASGHGGLLLFMSSIDSLYAAPGGEGVYAACKAAINSLTQTMAVELGQYRIRVNAIAPAVVVTPLTQPWFPTPEIQQQRSALYPMGRLGQPEDIAAAAVYLASDEAAWVSGAVLLISGGAVYTSDPYRYLTNLAAQTPP
jgi:NAD(P)-dependent dehydrogenase (short-subunit alcohol dehydrogenase family)